MIGSVMDAHPNMIIAHEFFVLVRCSRSLHRNEHIFHDKLKLFNSLYSNSYLTLKCGWRSDTSTRKGYNFNIDFPWQGAFRDLRVIGDKSGDSSVQVLASKSGRECLNDMRLLNMSVVAVHVVRNPYDMIATSVLYHMNKGPFDKSTLANSTAQEVSERLMIQAARAVYGHAQTISKLKSLYGQDTFSVFEIHTEDYIQNPRAVITEICEYFDIECPADYVDMCAKKTYRDISRTRDLIRWSHKILSYVKHIIRTFPFFHGYTFEDSFRKQK